MNLGNLISGSRQHRHDGSEPGIMVIPLDEPEAPNNFDDFNDYAGATVAADDTQSYDAHMAAIAEKKRQQSDVAIEIETFAYNAAEDDDVHEIDSADVDEPEELNLDDLEEMPLERKPLSATARRAMANTPLFAGLAPSALEALIARIELKSMLAGELLFREGDAGDALYIVSEGEVAVQSEGPPRVELVRLGSGAFFGEVALLTDQPRSATVTALAPTELLRIDRDVLRAILAEHPDVLPVVLRFVRDRLVDRMIRTSPLFRPFDDTERASLAARFRFLEIDKGAVIIPAGSKPDGLYILLAGRVEIRPANSSPIVLGSGDLIGEGSLLTGSKATDEVVATGKCLALCLPAAEFRELIMTHPHVLEYVGDQADARSRIQML